MPCFCVAVTTKDCTCLITTYNQLRKLWENKEKQNELSKMASQHNSGAPYLPSGELPHLHASMRGSNCSLGWFTLAASHFYLTYPMCNLSKTNFFQHNVHSFAVVSSIHGRVDPVNLALSCYPFILLVGWVCITLKQVDICAFLPPSSFLEESKKIHKDRIHT